MDSSNSLEMPARKGRLTLFSIWCTTLISMSRTLKSLPKKFKHRRLYLMFKVDSFNSFEMSVYQASLIFFSHTLQSWSVTLTLRSKTLKSLLKCSKRRRLYLRFEVNSSNSFEMSVYQAFNIFLTYFTILICDIDLAVKDTEIGTNIF